MKNIFTKRCTWLMLLLLTFSARISFAQLACCSANAGKGQTICCIGGHVTLHGSGTCNCTDTLPDTIVHCNKLLYSWKPTASLSNPNIAAPIATPTVTTTYTLTTYCYDSITHDTCCTKSATTTVTLTSTCCRLGAGLENAAINMYPNPATSAVTLELKNEFPNAEVFIYDNTGRMVLSRKYGTTSGALLIDLGGIAQGTYILQLQSDGAVVYSNTLSIE